MIESLAILQTVFQVALVLLLSPLVTGFNRTLKARVQTRRGPGLICSPTAIYTNCYAREW